MFANKNVDLLNIGRQLKVSVEFKPNASEIIGTYVLDVLKSVTIDVILLY